MEAARAGPALSQAYSACERLARQHYENFPVASRLLPRAMRPHVAAVYAFARTADDFADEGQRSTEERHRLLDDWLTRLRRCAESDVPASTQDGDLFRALGHTIRVCRLPVALFEDLVSAFRQDITVQRYDSWDEVLDYCRRSANPVGRLVLRIAGYQDQELDRASDAVCTALQLTNFWQDLEIDWTRGRLYLPAAEREACGAEESAMASGRITDGWRRALRQATDRTRALFEQGRPVCDRVKGRLGLELRVTWLGGMRILDRLEASGFDVFGNRPTLGPADVPVLIWHALGWRSS